MFKRRILISATILLVMICGLSHAKEPPTSIAQLNSPEYVIGSDSGGPGYDAAIQTFTKAKHLHFNDAYSGVESLKLGKIDALACNEMEIKAALRDSLKGLKLLPGTIGEPAKIGAGIYKHSKIPNLKEKFDSFIQDIKNDGTFSAMFKRWVDDGNYDMPAIDVPAKSDLTLRVATTGNVMPFSFYIGNTLTGFDIELARRFAASLGAELEFTINDFGGALSALAAGKADCMLSNLYITPERTEAITFSNVMYTVNMVVLVRDEGGRANDNGLQAFRGKRIGVPVGSSQSEIVREALPDSEMLYFEASANMIQALKSGKIDALAVDEPLAIEFERENKELTRANAILKPLEAGFIFPKKSGNEKLYSEINDYIRRIKSDGTFDQFRELWFGDDESKKIIPDYTNFPDTNGVIRFAVNDETPPFNYIKDGRLTGFDIDVIARFCKEKGYRPNFSEMNFTAILPAVMSGKCDMSGITVSITPERSESVRFSEPLHTLPTVLLVVKPRDIPATTPAKTSGNERTPKYSTLSELDGKPIGVQTGVPSWEAIARKILPHSKIAFYNTFADLDAALKTHKIEGFFVDEPVYNLMAAEDKNLAKIDEKIDDYYTIAFGFAKTERGKKLCDEMSAYIRKIKASGELDAIIAKWESADESAKTLPDYKRFPAPKGVLHVATEGEYPPFNYYRGNEIAGFEIDIAARFCEANGYGIEFTSMAWDAVIPAVVSGKYDFAAASLAPDDEHSGEIYFSEPHAQSCSVMACLKAEDSSVPTVSKNHDRIPKYKSLSELDGQPIGIQPAIYEWAYFVRTLLPHSQFVFYNTFTDILTALRAHKIEAFLVDEPVYNMIAAEDDNLAKIDEEFDTAYDLAYGFPKTDRGKKLCDEMSAYIRKIKASGELDAIIAKWESADESAKTLPDYKRFPAPKGVLHVATEGEYPPFNYYRDNKIAGYEIDIAARFCQEYGYGLKVETMTCDAIIAAVISGKCDFAADALTPSDEHLQQIYFSEPYSRSRSVMACLKADDSTSSKFAPLDGKPIGMQPGIIDWEEWVAENLPHSKVQYYNTYPDLVSALKTHKIAGFLVDSPVLALMAAEDKTLTAIDEPIGKPFGYSFIYAQTSAGKKLCDEMSEYIRKIKASGELDAIISKWQGADDTAKTPPDLTNIPAKNGTITYAAEGSYPPFSYYSGTKLAGIDIDIVAGFCRAYGYGLNVQTMLFDAMLPAVNSGKVDFAGDFTPSEEHEEAVYFSEPYCAAHSVMACLKTEDFTAPETVNPSHTAATFESLAGKKIGVQIGTTCAELVPEKIPTAEISYYDSLTDELTALKAGKVAAICCSLPAAIFAENTDSSLTRINPPLRETYLYPIFARTEQALKLCDEYSAFLKTLWDDGTINSLKAKWLGADEVAKTVDDYSNLPAMNGKIKMAVDASMIPFVYVRDNRIVGYDIDLAVRFCKAKGYALDVENMTFTGVIASVKSGKCDFTQSMNQTPERSENTLFTTTPTIKSGNVLLTLSLSKPATKFRNIPDLAGQKIGVMTGTRNPEIAKKYIPSAEIVHFNNMADTLIALKTGKIEAICVSDPVARFIMLEDDDIAYFSGRLTYLNAAPIFPKTEKGEKLRDQYSKFIKPLWNDGTIHHLEAKWFSEDASQHVIEDYSSLPNPNGTLKMAVDLSLAPFAFMKYGKIVGYDVDLAVKFCRANGYGLEVVPMQFGEIIPAVVSGKCDFADSAISVTAERAESVSFSFPNVKTGNVIVMLKSKIADSDSRPLSYFTGKNVGLLIGSDSAKAIEDKIPGVNLSYFDSPTYIIPALRSGRIDAFYFAVPTAMNLIQTHNDLAYIPEYVSRTRHTAMFPKTPKGRKLCNEYSDFLNHLWDDGTIDKLAEKWFNSNDESQQVTEDYSNLPAHNGTLKFAVTEGHVPFVFAKDNRIQGYDVDLAVMFCKSKGYGLEIEIMNHNGVLSSMRTGKCDFSYSVQWTEERAKTVLFSPVPNAETGSILVVMKRENMPIAEYTDISQLAGKKIGVTASAVIVQAVKEKIPDAELMYFESYSDLPSALMTRKIDAFACSLSTVFSMLNKKINITYLPQQLYSNYHSAAFAKTDKGRKLCNEYAEFLKTLSDDGTISRLKDKWIFSDDDNGTGIEDDYSDLPATNGTITMAVDPGTMPYAYVKEGKVTGYDVELAVMFCKAKGYGLEFLVMNLGGILGAVQTGKCDFTCGMMYTEERAQSVLFSPVPNMEAVNVVVVRKMNPANNPQSYMKLSNFAGKTIGVTVGTNHDSLVLNQIPDATIKYFSDPTDMAAALKSGKIDAFANTLPTAEYMLHEDKELAYLPEHLNDTDYFTCFTDTEEGSKLCEEYSEFVKSLWGKGVIAQLVNKWIKSDNDSLRTTEDYSQLPAVNGTLKMAADSGFVPFSYVKDNRIVGYDIDIAVMFCKEKGYGLEVMPMSFAGVLASLKTGKCHFTSSVIRTAERAETMIFSSVPIAHSANVLVVMKPQKTESPAKIPASRPRNIPKKETPSASNEPSFWDDIAASFQKTFIRESRWLLFAEGIMNTMIITVLSVFFGMVLGFTAFMFCRTGDIIANAFTKFSVWLIKGTPIVVLLMILYYVIFGSIDIKGTWVAVIAFTLTFGTSVYRMLTFGTGAVDRGQTEAAYALGFTDLQTFFTVILPQAALHFMPSFKEEVTMLIKSTSVVGYIAVQDLTKMGDIVRSRTYEAFFPLIAVAVIYFVLAGMLNIIVTYIHVRITPSKRKPEDILKGIKLSGEEELSHD